MLFWRNRFAQDRVREWLVIGAIPSIWLFSSACFAELASIETGREITRDFGAAEDRVELQQRLKEAGASPGKIDGIFGPATFRAIRKFRQMKGLPPVPEGEPLIWDDALKRTILDNSQSVPQIEPAATVQGPEVVNQPITKQPSTPPPVAVKQVAPAPQPPVLPTAPGNATSSQPPPPTQPQSTQNIVVTTHPDLAETKDKLKALDRALHDPELGIMTRMREADKDRVDGEKRLLDRLAAVESSVNARLEKNESKLDNYFWIFVGSIISAALALLGAAWNYAQNIEAKVESRVDKDIGKYLQKYGDLEKTLKDSVTGAEETLLVQIKEMENEVKCNRRNIAEAETAFSRMKAELELAAEKAHGRDADLEKLLKRVSKDFDAMKKDYEQTKLEQKHCLDNYAEKLEELEAKAKEGIELAKQSATQIEAIRGAFGGAG